MHTTNPGLDADTLTGYFGTRLTPMSFEDWLELVAALVDAGRRRYLCGNHNLHSLYLLRKDDNVRKFYARCDCCYIDGVPVRLPLAGAGIPTASRHRFSLMDEFPALLEQAVRRGWTLFYLGSEEAVVAKARERLRREYPGVNIALHHGYFEDDSDVIEKINSLRPDLLLVGMGMPRQETWLVDHIDDLDVVVAMQAGGTLDYFTGAQPKPPLWMSSVGLGGFYRLCRNPVRLWRRYLWEPWALVLPTLKLCLDSIAAKKPGNGA